jgi:D-alanyl-D-alanine carboxypeptidase/D-alanyl-D-alanine-endopeptidase (penicillin-binding protein 4)
MKHHFFWIFIIVVAMMNSAFAAAPQVSSVKKINTILNHAPQINTGILIVNLSNQKTIYQHQADRNFTPASNAKLFTAAASLWALGVDFKFKTTLWSNATIDQQGKLNGNIYFKFSGDPSLTSEDLQKLVEQLKQTGMKQINGQVILDASAFDRIGLGPGWMWDDHNQCFSAPITAIMINHNCFDFYLKSATVDQPAIVLNKENSNPYMQIENRTKTVSTASDTCPLDLKANNKNHYLLSGCATQSEKELHLNPAIRNPLHYAQQLIADQLQQAGITYANHIKLGHVPSSAHLIATHTSKPLSELVKTMLKESDNLIADALFKKLGQITFQQQGNWLNGQKAIAQILHQKTGLDFSKNKLVDGSGDSRYILVTPKQIVTLLKAIYADASIRSVFVDSLPIAGVDGTLQERLQTPSVKGSVFAKTGTMENVSSLSGFIRTRHHRWLVFSIMSNGFNEPLSTIHTMQDQICSALIAD